MAEGYWSRRLRNHFFSCRQETQRENELKGKAVNSKPALRHSASSPAPESFIPPQTATGTRGQICEPIGDAVQSNTAVCCRNWIKKPFPH